MSNKKKDKGKSRTCGKSPARAKSPLAVEDVVDGYAFFSFKSLDDVIVSTILWFDGKYGRQDIVPYVHIAHNDCIFSITTCARESATVSCPA